MGNMLRAARAEDKKATEAAGKKGNQ